MEMRKCGDLLWKFCQNLKEVCDKISLAMANAMALCSGPAPNNQGVTKHPIYGGLLAPSQRVERAGDPEGQTIEKIQDLSPGL